jgi:hypothetical protein
MRTALILSTVCAVALNAFAQQPAPAPEPSPTISVTGCVQQADADGSIAGTPLGTSAPPEQAGVIANRNLPWQGFLLADARPSAADAAETPAPATAKPANPADASQPTGTTGRAAALPMTYALDGNNSELAALKGQRVEVTGTVVEPAPSQAGASGSSTTFRTGVKNLKVTSIKSVGKAC